MLNHKNLIIFLLTPLFIGCGGGGSGETSTTISDTQIANPNVGSLTLAICEEKYGHYTNQQWAETGFLEDGEEKYQVNACYDALISSPLVGKDPQLVIDGYNRGDRPIKSNEPMIIEPSTLTIEELKAKQDAFPDEYGDEIMLNTLESCKEKYGHFSIEELGVYANQPRDVDIAVGQPMNGDAAYCHGLLLKDGHYSIK